MKTHTTESTTPPLAWIFTLYLLGVFMGALDTGIVTPARTVIQHQLGVDDASGIWLFTIYTLAYATAIPILGKLADRMGRKPVYLMAITLFGLGSLGCGLAQDVGSFNLLIISRAIQAIGGGGILPIATAELGTSVPKEKRGLALGLVGAVYAVANIFGSSAGSFILGLVGNENWQWIFYINLPISLLVILAGLRYLPNRRVEVTKPIDLAGITVLAALILALLYGIRNLDFFHLSTIANPNVYPFLLGAVALIPALLWVESRAGDPVLNLRYFRSREIVIALTLAFITGLVMMSVVFIPQFAENATHLPSGAGGYFVVILGLASGIGSPLSGRFTDRFDPKAVMGFGFAVSALAIAVLEWVAIPHPSAWTVSLTLFLIGLGMGFIMGSPLNYMMLEHTKADESNSALATLSLVRSIGTTIAPAIMAGFLAQAGLTLQPALLAELPPEIPAVKLAHAAELDAQFEACKRIPTLAPYVANLPKLESGPIVVGKSGGTTRSAASIELLRTADVTNIAARVQQVAADEFDRQAVNAIPAIKAGVANAIAGLEKAPVPPSMAGQIAKTITDLRELSDSVDPAFAGAKGEYLAAVAAKAPNLEVVYQRTLNEGFASLFALSAAASLLALLLLVGYRESAGTRS